jgi:hypothetical protein
MLLIYASPVTSRLQYILRLMIGELSGLSYSVTGLQEEYIAWPGPKICYSVDPLPGGFHITPSGLLVEQEIVPRTPSVGIFQGIPVLFVTNDPLSDLPFDPFAAAFYMVTRYEEYHASHRDKYGRFPVNESIAWQGGFLERPVVNEWASILGKQLRHFFPDITIRPGTFRYIPTIDIDHAYAYRHRPLIRTLGSMVKALTKGHGEDLILRFNVLAGHAPDPYDNYAYIRQLHSRYGTQPLYFVLFADYGGNDNNIPVSGKALSRLVTELDREKGVGIHPSLSSNKHFTKLESEYQGLCKLLNRRVTMSRQHFLKISLPKTYRWLIRLGITEDYSMGYASHPGFRAGIASSFDFFDLTNNEPSPLRIHPVSLMDVTLKDHLRLNPEKSIEKTSEVISGIKSAGGEFVSLWHNESLGEQGRWKGWRRVYEQMLRMVFP